MQESRLGRTEQDARADARAEDARTEQQGQQAARFGSESVAVRNGAGDSSGKKCSGVGSVGCDGRMPLKSSAGKEMKLPPPATALSSPAMSAAKKRKTG